eukprot:SAG11_NODE_18437_length_491_cov_1.043367_1_plen_112_part_01
MRARRCTAACSLTMARFVHLAFPSSVSESWREMELCVSNHYKAGFFVRDIECNLNLTYGLCILCVQSCVEPSSTVHSDLMGHFVCFWGVVNDTTLAFSLVGINAVLTWFKV